MIPEFQLDGCVVVVGIEPQLLQPACLLLDQLAGHSVKSGPPPQIQCGLVELRSFIEPLLFCGLLRRAYQLGEFHRIHFVSFGVEQVTGVGRDDDVLGNTFSFELLAQGGYADCHLSACSCWRPAIPDHLDQRVHRDDSAGVEDQE